MNRQLILFGLLAAAVLILIHLSEYSIIFHWPGRELIISLSALVLVVIGYFLSFLFRKKPTQSPPSPRTLDKKAIIRLGITERELEVLQLINHGHSNQEIAKKLYISESTVKTHVSSLLQKLDARRRTQAIKKARTAGILQ